MNPIPLVREYLEAGRLVDLVPGAPLDVPIYWQINRLVADRLVEPTREVAAAAGRCLIAETTPQE